MERQRADSARSADRRSQVGSGDRSERIRTYNFRRAVLTDHRINLRSILSDRVMQGEIGDVIDALIADFQASELARLGEGGAL